MCKHTSVRSLAPASSEPGRGGINRTGHAPKRGWPLGSTCSAAWGHTYLGAGGTKRDLRRQKRNLSMQRGPPCSRERWGTTCRRTGEERKKGRAWGTVGKRGVSNCIPTKATIQADSGTGDQPGRPRDLVSRYRRVRAHLPVHGEACWKALGPLDSCRRAGGAGSRTGGMEHKAEEATLSPRRASSRSPAEAGWLGERLRHG